jgi:hypothetical protein
VARSKAANQRGSWVSRGRGRGRGREAEAGAEAARTDGHERVLADHVGVFVARRDGLGDEERRILVLRCGREVGHGGFWLGRNTKQQTKRS